MRRELSVDLSAGGAGGACGTVSSKRVFGLSVEPPEPPSGVVRFDRPGSCRLPVRRVALAKPR